jgi:lysophospholipase L1-like esterase
MSMHRNFVDRAKKGDIELIFLGDSITQGWHGNDVWKKYYGSRHAVNFGIGGDRTQHVLWRLQHGEVDGIRPKLVVLMIGTNNSGANSAAEISAGIKAIIDELRKRLPASKVLVLGIFPRGQKPSGTREKLIEVNKETSRLDDGKAVRYLDIGKSFLEPDGTISPAIMPDYLHLSRQGYERWAEAMEPTLKQLLDEAKTSK